MGDQLSVVSGNALYQDIIDTESMDNASCSYDLLKSICTSHVDSSHLFDDDGNLRFSPPDYSLEESIKHEAFDYLRSNSDRIADPEVRESLYRYADSIISCNGRIPGMKRDQLMRSIRDHDMSGVIGSPGWSKIYNNLYFIVTGIDDLSSYRTENE